MNREKEWQWTIDEYSKHIKEDKPKEKKKKGMRGNAIHYENNKGYDVIDFVQDYKLNFNRGNVVKYIARAGKKDDELQDLYKAKDYIEREIQYIRDLQKKINDKFLDQ